MPRIMYYSTTGKSPLVDRRTAIVQGQPPDMGLYCPSYIPQFEVGEIDSLQGKPFSEVAFATMRKFYQSVIPDDVVYKMCKRAYNYPYPIERVSGRRFVERCDQGPTHAFKDTAARLMAEELSYYQKGLNKDFIVLVSTSGDTGAAIARNFYGLPGIIVIVLYPRDYVTKRQARLMDSLGGNVIALACDGMFNPLQDMCMEAFADQDLKKYNLVSANSINFARANPQVVHFIYPLTCSDVREEGEDIVFSIPSGNFGHAYAWFLAKRMGAFKEKGVIATNSNDIFPRFMKTGRYEVRPVINCISNAMNVNNPSNARRVFDLYGGRLVEATVEKMPDMRALHSDCFAVSISEERTRETIKKLYEEFGTVFEPHGAVGWAGLEEYLSTRSDNPVCVSIETAHPAKFPEELEKLGIQPELPEDMVGIDEAPSLAIDFSNRYKDLKEFIISGEYKRVLREQNKAQ